MNDTFPFPETIELEMDLNMEFSEANGCNVVYTPLYFPKSKKLSITAYGNCEYILNYLSISNENLNEITFNGMSTCDTIFHSLFNYKKLVKLTIGTSRLDEIQLRAFCIFPKLKILILDVCHLDWHLSDIMEFLKNVTTIRTLVLDHAKRDDQFQFTDEFVAKFNELLHQGRKLKIIYMVAGRKITLSKVGLKESVPRGGCTIQ